MLYIDFILGMQRHRNINNKSFSNILSLHILFLKNVIFICKIHIIFIYSKILKCIDYLLIII